MKVPFWVSTKRNPHPFKFLLRKCAAHGNFNTKSSPVIIASIFKDSKMLETKKLVYTHRNSHPFGLFIRETLTPLSFSCEKSRQRARERRVEESRGKNIPYGIVGDNEFSPCVYQAI